ncbi:hypothetical protein K474DRAFT_142325 [Panus rudis PR-1116 ss-1]|nr:hypothetical protein K474DRAFT_142325 [Panus rudis PR-1116 ss-1]
MWLAGGLLSCDPTIPSYRNLIYSFQLGHLLASSLRFLCVSLLDFMLGLWLSTVTPSTFAPFLLPFFFLSFFLPTRNIHPSPSAPHHYRFLAGGYIYPISFVLRSTRFFFLFFLFLYAPLRPPNPLHVHSCAILTTSLPPLHPNLCRFPFPPSPILRLPCGVHCINIALVLVIALFYFSPLPNPISISSFFPLFLVLCVH